MKATKQLLAILMSMLLCIMAVPLGAVTVSAETETTTGTYGDLTYEITDGKVTITDCDESATSVDIPSEIDGYPVTSIGESAFSGCTSLKSIIIPDSVTAIGGAAFQYCESIQTITIPDSVTQIGVLAFHGCTSLRYVKLSNSITYIDVMTFKGCSALESIVIPDSVNIIGESAFYNCISLKHVILPNLLKSIIGSPFLNCTSLKSIKIPAYVTQISDYALGYYFNSDTNSYEETGLTIYGIEGTLAQRHALEHDINFKTANNDIKILKEHLTGLASDISMKSLLKGDSGIYDVNADGFVNVFDLTIIKKVKSGQCDIEEISIEHSGFGITMTIESVDFTTEKFYTYSWDVEEVPNSEELEYAGSLNNEDVEEFMENAGYLFNKLDFTYDNYEYEDGDQWRIYIKYSNGYEKTVSGSNAYPEYWDEMNALFDKLTASAQILT